MRAELYGSPDRCLKVCKGARYKGAERKELHDKTIKPGRSFKARRDRYTENVVCLVKKATLNAKIIFFRVEGGSLARAEAGKVWRVVIQFEKENSLDRNQRPKSITIEKGSEIEKTGGRCLNPF